MRVLVGCERSGIVRDAFRDRGHEAFSCDLEGVEPGGKWRDCHLYGDVLSFLGEPWDMLIAFPPCTYLCNSGVRWLERGSNKDRMLKMESAATLFKNILNAPVERICIENPRMHKYAVEIIGRRQDQTIQPWQFGHGEQKATCLWLKNLPPLKPTDIVEGRDQRIWKMSPSEDRGILRSITYQGIAEAMAQQWDTES